MIDKTISHYKILEKLGEGGMGVVYKAEDTELKRNVALKFLAPQALGSEEERARFVREARSAASLDHPNICTVYEISRIEDQTFIAMAYVDGGSLKDRIEAGPLKLDDAVELAIQIAEGLQKAHEKGVIHRDIKPANIMVSTEGKAKIMDFGLAKSSSGTLLTRDGTTLGTVAYMSPEQARGAEVDGRSDIWSLGALLYEMVAGQRAFKGAYEPAVVYSILNQVQEPLTALRTGVPMELERIVNKCLAKEVAERYQTALDLVADLRHLKRAMTEAGTQSWPGVPPRPGVPSQPEVQSKPDRKSIGPWLWVFAVVAVVILAVALTRHFTSPGEEGAGPGSTGLATPEPGSERKMLVVLPFDNLGAPEDEYFADGITDEITSRLAALQGLGVISRTSSFQYKGADKTIKQIGEELGVGYVLEGTVRWEHTTEGESRVRVTPQLIRVSDDTQLWSERYDHRLQDIFAIQSQIAERVIEQLDVALLGSEREALRDRPTENMEAYQAYLRGLEHMNHPQLELHVRAAGQMFERAVALDPSFAMAYAGLSRALSGTYFWFVDRSDSCLVKAKAAADRALELQPELPAAHLALGYYYYWCHQDYDLALQELALAEEGLPNESEVLAAAGYIHRRQGRFETAREKLERAFELNPQDAHLAMEVAMTCASLRDFDGAIRYCDRAIFILPDYEVAYAFKAMSLIMGYGDLERSRAVLEEIPGGGGGLGEQILAMQLSYERDYGGLLDLVTSAPTEYVEAGPLVWCKALETGRVYRALGQPEVAAGYFDSAAALLESKAAERPDDFRLRSMLGMAYAGQGRKEDAIREGRQAVALCPLSRDAFYGPFALEGLADILVAVGEYDAALDEIERLLTIPAGITVAQLRLRPGWDPLREHPRYKRLLAEHSEARP